MSRKDPPSEERRETLARIALGGGVVAVGGLGYLTCRLASTDRGRFKGDVKTGLLPGAIGCAIRTLPRVFLFRDAQGALVALDRRCTHQACRVRATSDGRAFRCPCHGSRFDRSGVPQGGPAKKPLRKLRTSLDPKGRVVVHFGN